MKYHHLKKLASLGRRSAVRERIFLKTTGTFFLNKKVGQLAFHRNLTAIKRNLYEVPFYCVLTKLSNFNRKIKKFKKIWLMFVKKGLKYREWRNGILSDEKSDNYDNFRDGNHIVIILR
ncbi:hypothetical protein SAMN05878482_108114 [Peribacillus simplex]|uniref:Uncharacterized protein n=1 Tax=Peribacillus simplex TaxID=1478 RepID=A0A9X8RDB3_9BACI|nr:hypothetical protein SAMN05878482_108114 [Peribacillus simplex]